MNMSQKRGNKTAALAIFALVMLFNPNVNLFDIFPDFIGYFILASIFVRAADAAPHFEEARGAFLRLGYINLAKIAGIIIVGLVRSGNTHDYDIYALTSLVFAVVEIIYLMPAIKNIFDALTYLGERTDAKSLITSDTLISTESLRTLTYLFAVLKCALYFLPETLRLTGNIESGANTLASRFYNLALTASLVLGLIFGVIWLTRMIKYVKSIKKEGKFFEALDSVAQAGSYDEYLEKIEIRATRRTLLFFVLASVACIDLCFDNFNNVNLLPTFIYSILIFAGLLGICRRVKADKKIKTSVIVISVLLIGTGICSFFFSINFLDNFEYSDLLGGKNASADAAYLTYEISVAIETALAIGANVLLFILMKQYTDKNLGYSTGGSIDTKDSYHKALNVKTAILAALGSLCSVLNLLNVIFSGIIKVIYFKTEGAAMSSMAVSILPGFGLFVNIVTVVYIFYSVYYFNMIKEEKR